MLVGRTRRIWMEMKTRHRHHYSLSKVFVIYSSLTYSPELVISWVYCAQIIHTGGSVLPRLIHSPQTKPSQAATSRTSKLTCATPWGKPCKLEPLFKGFNPWSTIDMEPEQGYLNIICSPPVSGQRMQQNPYKLASKGEKKLLESMYTAGRQ